MPGLPMSLGPSWMCLLAHEPSDWNSDGYRWTLIALDTSRLMSNTHVEDAPIMDVVRITIGLINGQTACGLSALWAGSDNRIRWKTMWSLVLEVSA